MRPLVSLYVLFCTVMLSACQTPSSPPAITSGEVKSQFKSPFPMPQIDSGGHSSLIKDITFTKDGKYLVSAADDKIIRVWDIEQQKTVRTIRGQSEPGPEGKIYAMALSADNRWLAVGGWMDSSGQKTEPCCGDIRLYDFASGELVVLLQGHSSVVQSLAFSTDGRWLVSGSFDNTAILWDIKTRLKHRILEGHTDTIYAVAFTPDSQRVVTGSDDHRLKLWKVTDGALIATMTGHQDKVHSVAVTPDNRIVSGGDDRSIRLWSGVDGKSLGTLVQDQGTQLWSLSVSTDGTKLLSGNAGGGNYDTYLYSLDDGRELQRYTGHNNIVIATAFSPDNRLAATGGGGNNEIDFWSVENGERLYRLSGGGKPVWAVGFSQDGQSIAWGKTVKSDWIVNNYGALEFQLHLPDSSRPFGKPRSIDPKQADQETTFIRARSQSRDSSWILKHQQGGNYGYDAILEIQHLEKTIKKIERGTADGYQHRTYSFTTDDQYIISGGANGVLTRYDLDGLQKGKFIGHTGEIWSVAVSPDGQFLLSGSFDQTIRLWSTDTQELLFTLFHANDGEWVAWTPQGYYTASPKGDQLIGWQINRGVDKAAEYVSAAQLKQHFYRPDIIAASVRLGSSKQAVARADNTDFNLTDLLKAPPPRVTIKALNYLKTAAAPLLEIVLDVDESVTIDEYKLYIDDIYVEAVSARSTRREEHQNIITTSMLENSKNLRLVAINKSGQTVNEIPITLPKDFIRPATNPEKGDLYLLSIGIDQYPFLKRNLEFAENDARAFHELVLAQQSSKFNKLHEWLLSDNSDTQPTSHNIKDALQGLKQAKANDTVIVFFAGHGEYQGQDYYFLSSDSQQSNNRLLGETAVKWTDIQAVLKVTRGQRILLVDSCYSEKAYNPRLIKDAYDERIAVFTSTDAAYAAQEIKSLQHGVFTHALLKGMRGDADSLRRPDSKITLAELERYVEDEVMDKTNGQQRPQAFIGQKAKQYVISHQP